MTTESHQLRQARAYWRLFCKERRQILIELMKSAREHQCWDALYPLSKELDYWVTKTFKPPKRLRKYFDSL